MSDVVTERLGQLKSDRFFADDFRPEIDTAFGIEYIRTNTMLHVPRRHHPQLAPALEGVTNAFAAWKKLTGPRADPPRREGEAARSCLIDCSWWP